MPPICEQPPAGVRSARVPGPGSARVKESRLRLTRTVPVPKSHGSCGPEAGEATRIDSDRLG